MTLSEILLQKNIVDQDTLAKSRKEAQKRNMSLEDVLLERGVSEKDLVSAKSELLGVPVRFLAGAEEISFDLLKYIPEESARYYKFVPLSFKDGILEVGMVNPDNIEAKEALQFLASKLNLPFKIFLITPSDFQKILKNYKSLGGEARKVLGELETVLEEKPGSKEMKEMKEIISEERIVEEAPVTKMVGVILRHAVEGAASDIHIEPHLDKVKVRFRLDGILHTSLILPKSVHEAVVARVKILTNMKLDEKRRPQDGRFSANIGKRRIDFRVSTLPTLLGEKIAIRILDPQKHLTKLEELGLEDQNLELVKEALKKPYGLILLTGPTGSGKTTSLYAMLHALDRERFNVISLEDPVEYNIDGVNQSQIRPEIGYDFANGLRSILRQDPDIIMVGEIRDRKTAQLAIQASLTGHLVFSTLHTNDAVGVIPRLIDMGVDPYLIPSTLILAVAQRLVRTLCPDSKKPLKVKGRVKEKLEREMKDMPRAIREKIVMPQEIYEAKPSSVCPRGTKGRMGVFETFKMTPQLEKIILESPSEGNIMKEARRQGMVTMREDGILKVLKGKIGLEQLEEST
jgi:type IV pilus assembly protein PilB